MNFSLNNQDKLSLSFFKVTLLGLAVLFSAPIVAQAQESSTDKAIVYPYEKTFTISAYYSPVEGQKHYVRGSLEADRKLNGNGVHGADGTSVYPGMIAAPSSYPFGTKMKIPGIGTVSVHDRGGAIVKAGQKGQSFDRLDIWMGSGDEGLTKALKWGKRNITVMVYGQDNSLQENIDLSDLGESFKDFSTPPTPVSQALIYQQDFGLGDSNDQITEIKQKFQQMNLFDGTVNNQFDAKLYQAVMKFQLQNQIIDSDDDFGAGYFGPQTRKTFEKNLSASNNAVIKSAQAANTDAQSQKIALAGNGLSFLDRNLSLGDSNQAVLELQTELGKMNLLGIDPTGYYGPVTAHAVFKFQQIKGLKSEENQSGAGDFDDITRSTLAALVNTRVETRRTMADNAQKDKFLAKD